MTGFGERRKGWREGLTGYHYLVLVVACLGWSFDTMDQWLFVFSKQHAIASLLGAAGTKESIAWYNGLLTAIMMIGWASGGLLVGRIGAPRGRCTAGRCWRPPGRQPPWTCWPAWPVWRYPATTPVRA
jgi:hypothetical protein